MGNRQNAPERRLERKIVKERQRERKEDVARLRRNMSRNKKERKNKKRLSYDNQEDGAMEVPLDEWQSGSMCVRIRNAG